MGPNQGDSILSDRKAVSKCLPAKDGFLNKVQLQKCLLALKKLYEMYQFLLFDSTQHDFSALNLIIGNVSLYLKKSWEFETFS